MKLVHFSDTHLGFRQYPKQNANGFNQREVDVERAFELAIAKTIELHPDVVVVGGDVFHTVRPTNRAAVAANREFWRLRQALPQSDIVIVAGNHDTPNTTDSENILKLFPTIGIIVVAGSIQRLSLRGGELSILAVPDHMRPLPALEPDDKARFNVLLMHDEVKGILGHFTPKKEGDLESQALNSDRWNYVALGHYHVYTEVAKNAYYSGSLEYTSSNIWREVHEESKRPVEARGKGIIEHDLATGEHRFHLIQLTRKVIDLPVVNGTGMTPEQLTDAICAASESCKEGLEGNIVRQVVLDVAKPVAHAIDHRRLRKFRAKALNYLLDIRAPEVIEVGVVASIPARRKAKSLGELMSSHIAARETSPGIDINELTQLALKYLDEAEVIVLDKAAAADGAAAQAAGVAA